MWGRMGVWLGMGARSRDSTGQETCQPFIHTTRYTRSTLSLGTLNVDGAGGGGLRGHANNRGSRQAGRDMDLDLKLLRMYHSLHYSEGNIPLRK